MQLINYMPALKMNPNYFFFFFLNKYNNNTLLVSDLTFDPTHRIQQWLGRGSGSEGGVTESVCVSVWYESWAHISTPSQQQLSCL